MRIKLLKWQIGFFFYLAFSIGAWAYMAFHMINMRNEIIMTKLQECECKDFCGVYREEEAQ